MWTLFWDRYITGKLKTKWSHIFIEAHNKYALKYFENRFKIKIRSKEENIIWDNFSIHEGSLKDLTKHARNLIAKENNVDQNSVTISDLCNTGKILLIHKQCIPKKFFLNDKIAL